MASNLHRLIDQLRQETRGLRSHIATLEQRVATSEEEENRQLREQRGKSGVSSWKDAGNPVGNPVSVHHSCPKRCGKSGVGSSFLPEKPN